MPSASRAFYEICVEESEQVKLFQVSGDEGIEITVFEQIIFKMKFPAFSTKNMMQTKMEEGSDLILTLSRTFISQFGNKKNSTYDLLNLYQVTHKF